MLGFIPSQQAGHAARCSTDATIASIGLDLADIPSTEMEQQLQPPKWQSSYMRRF